MVQGLETGKAKCTGAGGRGLKAGWAAYHGGALFTGSGDSGKVSEEWKIVMQGVFVGRQG